MKAKFLTALLLFFAIFLFSTDLASAAIRVGQEHETVSADEIIDDDLYITGEAVTIDGQINGDVYVAAGAVMVTGRIEGDLIAAGGTITLSEATVNEDVRIAAGNFSATNTSIGDSLTTFAGNVSVTGGQIGGGVNFGSGSNLFKTAIGRGLIGGGGSVTIDSQVGNDITVGSGSLTLGPTALVGGNLEYYSESEAYINQSAIITGETNFHKIESAPKMDEDRGRKVKVMAIFGFKFWGFLATLLSGFLLITFLPKALEKLSSYIIDTPATTFGWGLLKLLLVVPALILLVVTIVGIPLAGIMLLIFIVEAYLAKHIVSLALGTYLVKQFKLKIKNVVLIFTLGLVVYSLVTAIPVLGGLACLVGLLFGLGSLTKYFFVIVKTQKK